MVKMEREIIDLDHKDKLNQDEAEGLEKYQAGTSAFNEPM